MNVNALRDTWKNLEPRGQLTLVGSALLVLVTVVFLFHYASKPTYATVATGLDPAEVGDVQNALSSAGVDYQLENGGTAIAVRKGQESSAQVALASNGLPKGGHVGFEIFDKSSLSTSNFQQNVNYQRALEGEIARTIEQIDGVQGADVQLVLPDEALFSEESPKASAAVLLTTSGALDASSISGIARLVASSVKGLALDNVTITDGTGALLWPTADGGATGTGGSKLAAEQRYSAQVSAQIQALLL